MKEERKVKVKKKKTKEKKESDEEVDIVFEDPTVIDEYEEKQEDETKPKHNALTESRIVDMRINIVQDVMEVAGVPHHIALSLLSKFNWDKHELLSKFAENPDLVLSESGLTISNTEQKKKFELPNELDCSVCFDITVEFTHLPACGHIFCNLCWKENLVLQIKEGNTINITCMSNGCKELVPDFFIKKIGR